MKTHCDQNNNILMRRATQFYIDLICMFRNVERLDGNVYAVENAHNGVINAIDTAGSVIDTGASEIVTGGQDGLVKVWDPRCKHAVVQIQPNSEVIHSYLHDVLMVLSKKSAN